MRAATRLSHRVLQAAAGIAATALATAPAASAATTPESGSNPGLVLSASAGPVGSVVEISGNAGPGCVAGNNWFGFDIAPVFPASGPVDQITPSLTADGSWTVSFQIPSWMSGAANRGPGAATTPGQYLITAPTSCTEIPPPKAVATFTVTPGVVPSPEPDADAWVGIAATPDGEGYWIVAADGAVIAFGDATSFGSLTLRALTPAAPIVGIAPTPDGRGYWLAGADGGVFAFGNARSFGSLPAKKITPAAPIVGIAPTPDGRGYWLLGADGGVFAFGDARFAGSTAGDIDTFEAIGSIGRTGYALSGASFGALVRFPGGENVGSHVGTPLAASLSGAAFTTDGRGAWQVGLDGGVRTLGDAVFEGSLPGARIRPDAPIVGIAPTPDDRGYWLLGTDGGIFTFGDAAFHGSAA